MHVYVYVYVHMHVYLIYIYVWMNTSKEEGVPETGVIEGYQLPCGC